MRMDVPETTARMCEEMFAPAVIVSVAAVCDPTAKVRRSGAAYHSPGAGVPA